MLETLDNKNMLFLEDSEEFIENVKSVFEMYVSQCFVAHSIDMAKTLLNDERIDFIVSDIHLKNENGLDFAKYLRDIDNNIPIIILSGDKNEDLLLKAIPLNLVGYLTKPINFKALIDILTECAKRLQIYNKNLIELKDDFVYDINQKVLVKNDTLYELNKKEILFFELLAKNKSTVITKDMIASTVYADEIMSDSALNNFVLRLRKKFGKSFLHTIPDVGYKFIL